MKIDIIIPVHNLQPHRSLKRLEFLLESLTNQTHPLNNIWISCSSKAGEHMQIIGIAKKYRHTWVLKYYGAEGLSLPLLHKWVFYCRDWHRPDGGNDETKPDYIATTGADFIFRKDTIAAYVAELEKNPQSFLMKQCRSLPRMNLTFDKVRNWTLPSGKECYRKLAKQGAMHTQHMDKNALMSKIANGALQMAPFDFWANLDYPLNMSGLGAYDHYCMHAARKAGLKTAWVEGGEIAHIFHKISPMKYSDKFKENTRFCDQFVKQG